MKNPDTTDVSAGATSDPGALTVPHGCNLFIGSGAQWISINKPLL